MSQEWFLSSVEEDWSILLVGGIMLGLEERLAPQRYVVHLRADKQGMSDLAVLAHLLVPLV